MREIKFRAWDTGTKKIIRPEFLGMNGHFIEPSGKGIFSLQHTVFTTDGFFKDANTGEVQDADRIEGYMLKPWQMANSSLELMQYTGLKDKNGKEIYEGDIVAYLDLGMAKASHPAWHGVVKYEAPAFVIDGLIWRIQACEMIGNIYENPELLK